MMASRAILSLCAALAASGGTARADAFTTFKTICIDTQANDTDSLAAADKDGWMPMPQAMLDKFPLKSYQGEPQGRIRSSADGLYLMATADSIFPNAPNAHGKMCMMAFSSDDPGIDGRVDDFAAAPKHLGKNSDYFYLWREENGAHVAISEEEFKSPTMPAGAIHFLGTGQGAKMSFLVFGIASLQN
jgi:hypothetical protein